MLSEETGGFAVVNRNDFATAFQRIVDDNSAYYVMGYYSTNDRRDGRFRKIEVKLNDKPGLVVRARKGYVAPRGTRAGNQADDGELGVAGTARCDREPAAAARPAAGHDRGGVQGAGAEGVGGDLDAGQRQHAAVRRGRRHVQERSRSDGDGHRREGQDHLRRSQHREPEHEARLGQSREGQRLPRHPVDRPRARAATSCAWRCARATPGRPAR